MAGRRDCECRNILEDFFNTSDAMPRLKTKQEEKNANQDYAKFTSCLPKRNDMLKGSRRPRYRLNRSGEKEAVYVGRQVDPCPLKVAFHTKLWNHDTTVQEVNDQMCPHCSLYKHLEQNTTVKL